MLIIIQRKYVLIPLRKSYFGNFKKPEHVYTEDENKTTNDKYIKGGQKKD